MRIKASRLVDDVVRSSIQTLPANMPIEDARQQIVRSSQVIFPVLDDQELIGVLSKSDLINPPQHQLVLVDHNEIAQAVEGAEDADIIEVLDHHRVGGSLKSTHPIRFYMEPVGSTCTMVARMFNESTIKPHSSIALCMATGIISDTLFLRSPTTTDTDREMLDWLQQFCKVDLKQYADEFFQVGSALRTCTPQEVVCEDCKEFDESGRRFSISQIEETGFELFWERKSELTAALLQYATEQKLEFAALLVTDITTDGSLLLMSAEPEGWEEINFPSVEDRLYQLDGVVSRKKQLLPLIISLLEFSPVNA